MQNLASLANFSPTSNVKPKFRRTDKLHIAGGVLSSPIKAPFYADRLIGSPLTEQSGACINSGHQSSILPRLSRTSIKCGQPRLNSSPCYKQHRLIPANKIRNQLRSLHLSPPRTSHFVTFACVNIIISQFTNTQGY